MRIIAKRTLRQHWERRPDSEQALKAWHAEVSKESWATPAELKEKYRSASILKKGRVVFNICGNKYRLVTGINFELGIVFVKFIGTHEEYDQIDAENVDT